jgi:hypothetical protein
MAGAISEPIAIRRAMLKVMTPEWTGIDREMEGKYL